MKAYTLLAAALMGSASAFCPNSCSGHGECGESDKCNCYPKFTGSDCSLRQCTYGLSWVAGTESELMAASVPNYMHHHKKAYHNGHDVNAGEVQGFHAYTECSGKGVCDHVTGLCKCFAGYTGSGCRRSACANDCSGHGRCVLDGDLYQTSKTSYTPTDALYGENRQLWAQNQYWNNAKTTQCVCDAGFTGADCSTRMCPKGDDPSTSCATELDYSDVQLVGLRYKDPLDVTKPENFEQFFTLKFTDMFNNEYESKPLSYFDTAKTVQDALMGLPNFAIPDVEVFKTFPEITAGDDQVAYTGGANGADPIVVDGVKPESFCSTFYHEAMQDVSCAETADCVKKFGLPASKLETISGAVDVAERPKTAIFCDLSASMDAHVARGAKNEGDAVTGRGICVETMNSCAFIDGKKEFNDLGCGDQFEPDGIYDASPKALIKDLAAAGGAAAAAREGKCLAHFPFYKAGDGTFKGDAGALCAAKEKEADCSNLIGGVESCYWSAAASDANGNQHVPSGMVWGRRLTSFERSCHVGKYDENKVAFAVACKDDSDCTRCGGWTQVVAGVCDSGTCKSLSDATADGDGFVGTGKSAMFPMVGALSNTAATTKFNAECRTTVLGIKFANAGTPGIQNLLEVTTGDMDTIEAGAAPMFKSSGLMNLGVIHAGLPDFVQGRESKLNVALQYEKGQSQPKDFQVYLDVATGITLVDKDTCKSSKGLTKLTKQCLDYHHLNFLAKAQTYNVQSYEGDEEDVPKIVNSPKAVYTAEEIESKDSANYDEVLQCSNQGSCGYDTGLCTCASGFTGDSCGTQISFV